MLGFKVKDQKKESFQLGIILITMASIVLNFRIIEGGIQLVMWERLQYLFGNLFIMIPIQLLLIISTPLSLLAAASIFIKREGRKNFELLYPFIILLLVNVLNIISKILYFFYDIIRYGGFYGFGAIIQNLVCILIVAVIMSLVWMAFKNKNQELISTVLMVISVLAVIICITGLGGLFPIKVEQYWRVYYSGESLAYPLYIIGYTLLSISVIGNDTAGGFGSGFKGMLGNNNEQKSVVSTTTNVTNKAPSMNTTNVETVQTSTVPVVKVKEEPKVVEPKVVEPKVVEPKNSVELLKELSALKDAGIISEEEFNNKKTEILESL